MKSPPLVASRQGRAHSKACRGTFMAPEGSSVARTAHPWFWEECQGWYVLKDGQRHFLGGHPADAPPPKKTKKKWNAPPVIMQAFHALMASPPEQPKPEPAASTGLTVVEVLDKFVVWCQQH